MHLHNSGKGLLAWVAAIAFVAGAGANAQPPPASAAQPGSFAPLVDRVKDVVVNVEVAGPAPQRTPSDEFFERFFGPQRPRQGLGSGIMIEADGWLLTNNHVVEGAKSIRVKLHDGRRFDAEVVGRDPLTDVALVKLKGQPRNLPFARLGDSDALRVGDWVIAIGNPFGLASSVSAGIVSARARNIEVGPYDEFLQTDAAINPGNSGGPLFNTAGEVIGMNTAMVGGGTGIGFAVPSNLIKTLLPQLKKEGVVTRGWLGVFVQELTADLATALKVPVQKGAVVTQVQKDSPAAKANLRPEDVIIALNGEPLDSASALTRRIAQTRPGSSVKMRLYREGKIVETEVKIGTRPDLEGLARRRSETTPQQEQGLKDRFGMTIIDVPGGAGRTTSSGALVVEVAPGSAAARAELEPGMVIVGIGNTEIKNAEALITALRGAKPGSTLALRIRTLEGEGTFLRALTVPNGAAGS